ncbi:MAG: hypothetical protein IPM42_17595 [Saprospiraceae bacterium]|nr:hypothetical protein [Saprospiraceae bacterium]
MYKQQYNFLEGDAELIIETDILVKPFNKQPETIKHQTLIVLSGFAHEPFEIEDAIKSLMFNLRHNIFDKIKSELGITDAENMKILSEFFPSEGSFSCVYNSSLTFNDYDFSPPLNLNNLVEIHY